MSEKGQKRTVKADVGQRENFQFPVRGKNLGLFAFGLQKTHKAHMASNRWGARVWNVLYMASEKVCALLVFEKRTFFKIKTL